MKRLLPVLLVLLLGLWYIWPTPDEKFLADRETSDSLAPKSRIENSPSKIPALAAERSTLADTLNSPATDIRADLRLVSAIIDTFRSNFPQLGNPVGNNPEITAALTGKNKLQFAFIPPNHPAINRAGELCDRWGTPFYFHAESGTHMAIRSAGPDKKLHTEDDVVLTP